jgi:hypothetical protein
LGHGNGSVGNRLAFTQSAAINYLPIIALTRYFKSRAE